MLKKCMHVLEKRVYFSFASNLTLEIISFASNFNSELFHLPRNHINESHQCITKTKSSGLGLRNRKVIYGLISSQSTCLGGHTDLVRMLIRHGASVTEK